MSQKRFTAQKKRPHSDYKHAVHKFSDKEKAIAFIGNSGIVKQVFKNGNQKTVLELPKE